MNAQMARLNMVEHQIRANRVTDPAVLSAMAAVPREVFAPKALRPVAFVDEDLPLDDGRYLMEPLVLARLVQAAAIQPEDVVLDVGCATGYSSAVLAHIANTVVALESAPDLAARAIRTLTDLALDNAVVVTGPLAQGYPDQAPYDVIVIGGAVPSVPDSLRRQLADGGRLVAVVGSGRWNSRITVFERHGDAFGQRTLFDAATPALPGFEAEETFVF